MHEPTIRPPARTDRNCSAWAVDHTWGFVWVAGDYVSRWECGHCQSSALLDHETGELVSLIGPGQTHE